MLFHIISNQREVLIPMEDLLHDFLLKYFYDSVSQRRFEDRCRQLSRHTGPVPERKQILDDCLKQANGISVGYSELESSANKLLAIMQDSDSRDDVFMSTVAEALAFHRTDKMMADDFSLCIFSKQIGQERRPMRRPVVNPLEELVEEEEDDEETVIEEAVPETVPEEPVSEEPAEDPETAEETAEEKPEEEAED